jgi:tRNA A-37 threonylcarbamoyl transferase component Bud32/tetratricopeptide (TPR) repeat protein
VQDKPGEEPTAATIADAPRRRARATGRPAPLAEGRLGHFQLLEPLGHGGMGAVYSAFDLRLDRKVALKLLAKRGDSPEDDHNRNQRLLREAQAMAKLSHPNVVPVYEVGVDHGTVFIAMEYVAGRTLGKWLKEEKRTWREIVAVFAQAARGLAAAHEAGIVHRDFKPANVLVDDRGHVRVVDFGIAQVHGASDAPADLHTAKSIDLGDGDELTPPTPSTPLTEQGSLVGTPAYMSPEQYKSATVDARSDQWSFSVAMFEALYGKRPFVGRGKTLADNVTHGVVDKPDAKTDVPGWVHAIAMRGIAHDPEARFPSMSAVADALAADPGRTRRRIAAGVVAAAAIAGVAALVGSRLGSHDQACTGADARLAGVWDDGVRAAIAKSFAGANVPYAESSAQRVTAILDGYRATWIDMRTDACRATRVRGEQSEHVLDLRVACLDDRLDEVRALTSRLTATADAAVVEHAVDAATALAPVTACADSNALLRGTAENPALRARLDQLLVDRRLGHTKDVLPGVRALVADARGVNDVHVLARALELQGEVETRTGDLKAANTTLGEALRRARLANDPDAFVAAAIDLVDELGEGGISTSREALGVARVAEAVVDDADDPALGVKLAFERADEYMTLARPDLALPILEQTLERGRRVLGPDHVLLLQIQSLYASCLNHQERYPEARAQFAAVVERAKRVLGPLHPMTLGLRVHTCRALAEGNARAEGAACFQAELPDAIRVVGAHNRELLSHRAAYGLVLAELGKHDEARAVFAAAYADVPADAWAEQWFVGADLARTLGALELEAKDYSHALAHCQQGDAATEGKHKGPAGATCMAEALLGLGEPARALDVLEPMRPIVERADPMTVDPGQIAPFKAAYAKAKAAAHK